MKKGEAQHQGTKAQRAEGMKDLFVELGELSSLLGAAFRDALQLRAAMMSLESADYNEADAESMLILDLGAMGGRLQALMDGLGYQRVGISFIEGEGK